MIISTHGVLLIISLSGDGFFPKFLQYRVLWLIGLRSWSFKGQAVTQKIFIDILVKSVWKCLFLLLPFSSHYLWTCPYLICSLECIKAKTISDSTKKSLSKSIKPILSYSMTSQRSSSESRLLIGPREKTRSLIG